MSPIWLHSSSTCSSLCVPTTQAGGLSVQKIHFEDIACVMHYFFYCLFTRDQDNAIVRPLPKIKRMISDNACLPHIVQVIALNLILFPPSLIVTSTPVKYFFSFLL